MNELIKQLAKQSGIQMFEDKSFGWSVLAGTDNNLKKFAELIVRECTKVVENLSPGYDDYRNQIEDAFRRDCVEQMKQHFGVEE